VSTVRFEPVERRTVANDVRVAISDRIRNGDVPPGSPLPSERDLCSQFGVARTSVREAIQALSFVGLVERRGNRTYVVEHLPEVRLDANGGDRRKRRVHELFEVRRLVELPIARFAAERASAGEREEIARIAAGFRADMPLEEFRALDRSFHWAVAKSCGNDTLAEVYGKVLESLFASNDFAELLTAKSNRRAVREVIRSSTEAHRSIAAAIADGDGAGVMKWAEQHLDDVEGHMISKMT
jgi:DNA-binding FadR family transcriptional regulator